MNNRTSLWIASWLIIVLMGLMAMSSDLPVNSTLQSLPASEVELGTMLFNDPLLSADSSISCASCHRADFAFADVIALSFGVNGTATKRNTPSAMYMSKRAHFFWDGRASTLEQQASGPITAPGEMNLPLLRAITRLNRNPYYRLAFQKIYKRLPDSTSLVTAIAAFERTLEPYDSPYDRFLKGNDDAMSASAIRGFNLFYKQSTCAAPACHTGDDFSSDSLVNLNVNSKDDMGRYGITSHAADMGKFKVPHLRNVAVTAPYMHDGSVKTLRDVIVFYNDMNNFPLASLAHPSVKHQRPRPLTNSEVDDLVEFMKALTDSKYQDKIR